jgi:hypothetical protein
MKSANVFGGLRAQAELLRTTALPPDRPFLTAV